MMIFRRALMPDGHLDFYGVWKTVSDVKNIRTIINTLILSLSVVCLSTIIAVPLAFITAGTDIGKRKWLDVVLMIPFMTPPYIASMGWILFVQKRGLFQQLFPGTGSISEKFFSFGGLVLVMSLHVFPFMLTIVKNALSDISAGMEESARVSGGKFLYRLRRITLPLITGNYAVGALLVFVKTATEIHRSATIAPVDFGRAASLSGLLTGICFMAWFIQNYISFRMSYKTVGGKGSGSHVYKLKGISRISAWVVIISVLAVSIGIPYFSVTVTSLIKLRGYGIRAGNFTFSNFTALFTANPKGRQAFSNSIFLSLSSATIAAVTGTADAAAVQRSKSRFGKIIEGISILPEMLPGIVLIIGIMLFWNSVYKIIPIYNTIWIMVLAYMTLYLPYTVQYVGARDRQLGMSLFEAGRISGGSPFYIFRKITLPLLSGSILAGWMMTFIISFRELVTASLIAPPNTLVVSTFIMSEFEQGSVSVGMAMAVICVLFTTVSLILVNKLLSKTR